MYLVCIEKVGIVRATGPTWIFTIYTLNLLNADHSSAEVDVLPPERETLPQRKPTRRSRTDAAWAAQHGEVGTRECSFIISTTSQARHHRPAFGSIY
jgi:hypothetical protein